MVCAPVQRDNLQTLERGLSTGIIDHTGAQTIPYLTCTMISSVDLAYHGVSGA